MQLHEEGGSAKSQTSRAIKFLHATLIRQPIACWPAQWLEKQRKGAVSAPRQRFDAAN